MNSLSLKSPSRTVPRARVTRRSVAVRAVYDPSSFESRSPGPSRTPDPYPRSASPSVQHWRKPGGPILSDSHEAMGSGPVPAGRRVLCAVDDTDDAARGLAFALASGFIHEGDALHLVHIVPDRLFRESTGAEPSGRRIIAASDDVASGADPSGTWYTHRDASAREFMRRRFGPVLGAQPSVLDVVFEDAGSSAGALGDAILRQARELGAQLVIVFSHVRGVEADFGSVARHCAQEAGDTPVLVIHGAKLQQMQMQMQMQLSDSNSDAQVAGDVGLSMREARREGDLLGAQAGESFVHPPKIFEDLAGSVNTALHGLGRALADEEALFSGADPSHVAQDLVQEADRADPGLDPDWTEIERRVHPPPRRVLLSLDPGDEHGGAHCATWLLHNVLRSNDELHVYVAGPGGLGPSALPSIGALRGALEKEKGKGKVRWTAHAYADAGTRSHLMVTTLEGGRETDNAPAAREVVEDAQLSGSGGSIEDSELFYTAPSVAESDLDLAARFIAREAAALDALVVVIANRRRSMIEQLLHGSVESYLLSVCKAPMLILH